MDDPCIADSGLSGALSDHPAWRSVAEVMSAILLARQRGGIVSVDPDALPEGPPCSRLRPETELQGRQFGWPEHDFALDNCVRAEFGVEPWIHLLAGDAAVDFTLEDIRGGTVRLGDLLRERPVVLTYGMYSCPAYQISKTAEARLARQYGDRVSFVHVYSVDPHPKIDNAPDIGRPWQLIPYSRHRQARTVEGRRELCAEIADNHPICQHVVMDDLDLDGRVNPVWSTYGPAPRPAFLIRQDGLIHTSQLWFTASKLTAAIDALISKESPNG